MGIGKEEALEAFRSDDLIGLGMEADAVRRRLHPEGVVTYSVMATVRWTADPGALCEQAASALARGASGVALAGAPFLNVDRIASAIAALRARVPEASIEALGAEQIGALAAAAGASVLDIVQRLRDAGLDTPLAEGPPLVEGAMQEWLEVHREAHRAGMRTVAAMLFGAGEAAEARVGFLHKIDALQQETGGFAAFVPEPVAAGLQGPTAVDSLKTVAISRLMLEGIANIEASQTQGLKVLETGLRFGANDAGPVALTSAPDLREEDLRRVIRDAGFAPVERDAGYRMQFLG